MLARPICRPPAGIINGRATAQPQLRVVDTFSRENSSMTAAELKRIRSDLGLSIDDFARIVGAQAGRTVRHWESGDRAIPGSVAILADLIATMPAVRRRLVGRPRAPC